MLRTFDCNATVTATDETIVICRHKGGMIAGGSADLQVAVLYETAGEVELCSEVSPRLADQDEAMTRSCAPVTVAP